MGYCLSLRFVPISSVFNFVVVRARIDLALSPVFPRIVFLTPKSPMKLPVEGPDKYAASIGRGRCAARVEA